MAPRAQGGFARDAARREIASLAWRETKSHVLAARAPNAADGRVDVGGVGREWLGLSLLGAAPVPAEVHAGRVVYADAFAATSRVIASNDDALEDLLILSGPSAPHQFTWKMHVPSDVAVRRASGGGLALRNVQSGRDVATVEPTFAIDAQGTRRALPLAWSEASSTFTLDVDDTGLVYPIAIDPRLNAWSWRRISNALRRYDHGMAYDAARNQVVVFGGAETPDRVNADTFVRAADQWVLRAPAHSPSPRSALSMTYDAVRQNILVFGGDDKSETWTWDGTDWTQRMPPVSPPYRQYGGQAFDAARGVTVLSGGWQHDTTTQLADTWTWDGTTWTEQHPAHPLPLGDSMACAFDSFRSEVVCAGGFIANTYSRETYTWDGTDWTKRNPAHRFTPRYQPALSFDAARGVIVLFSGADVNASNDSDTWEWDGVDWSQRMPVASPPARNSAIAVFDTARAKTVLFGGYTALDVLEDAWAYDGTTWSKEAASSPLPRTAAAIAYDEARGETMVFGGRDADGVHDDTWTSRGGTWTRHDGGTHPSKREDAPAVYDRARGNVVMFAGYDGSNAYNGETWIWDGSTWSQRASGAISPRAVNGLAYDLARQVVVLFGGFYGGSVLDDTWLWNGTSWVDASPPMGAPRPPAGGNHLVYDEGRRLIVRYTSGDAATPWTCDGTAWTQGPTSTSAPSKRRFETLVYEPTHGVTVLLGGNDYLKDLAETWTWDGARWNALTFSDAPSARSLPMAVFDTSHQVVTLYSGESRNEFVDDAWVLARLGGTCAATSECPGGSFCVDGVCCSTASCGTCATCAGLTPGRCSAVTNREDADSCALAAGQSCNDIGDCGVSTGAGATSAAQCASGFLVDGVCCDTACNGACQACAASQKESRERSGVCGNAQPDTCACRSNAECAAFQRCGEAGVCVVDQGVVCQNDRTLVSASGMTTDCGFFKCQGAACRTTCTSRTDCAPDADCTADHLCVAFAKSGDDGGGCRAVASPANAGHDSPSASLRSGPGSLLSAALACATMAAMRRGARRRARHS